MRDSICLGLIFSAALLAQAVAPPAFEVASIKLNTSGSGSVDDDSDKAQILIQNMPMKRLLQTAYHINPPQVIGPDWIESARFDIAAKYPPNATSADRGQMLRTLLEDRFKLTVHHETRDLNGYSMVVAKGGFKLKPVEGDDNNTDHHGGRVQGLAAKGTTMAFLAQLVSRYAETVVVDNSGIDGNYSFDLRWTNQEPTGQELESVPNLFDAIQETLGLRFQPQKVKADVVVIDHIERMPTEN